MYISPISMIQLELDCLCLMQYIDNLYMMARFKVHEMSISLPMHPQSEGIMMVGFISICLLVPVH